METDPNLLPQGAVPQDSNRTGRSSWLLAAGAGVAATAFGLGIAELVAGVSRDLRSPIVSVGDRIVDNVPSWLKNLAIDWFGTADKLVLLLSIGAVIALASAVVGVFAARKSVAAAVTVIAVAGLVGALAAWQDRAGADIMLAIPTLAGTAVAMLTMAALAWQLRSAPQTPENASNADTGRRRVALLLVPLFASAMGAGLVGRILRGRFDVEGERAQVALPAASSPTAAPTTVATPAPTPEPGQSGATATVGETPQDPAPTPAPAAPQVQDLSAEPGLEDLSSLYTPNEDFYRIDTALEIPQVSVDTWELKITGMVDSPYTITFQDLLDGKYGPIVEEDITLSCVSNEIGGNLVGHARWLGVRLDELLERAGIDPAANQIVGRSVDGYTCGFPVSTLDGRNALVAVGMNGEPLPTAHGFPARLIVPGLYGYVSATKWLTEIELTTFDAFDSYWVPRGWDAEAPIKTQARIDTPRPLIRIDPGETMIGGVAWAQTRGITSVEVQIDDGPWNPAELAPAINDDSWRQWTHRWNATSGRHTITVRATDGTGELQTADRVPPQPNGASGRHQIVALVA